MNLQQLLALNPQLQANPNLIRPGQTVNLSGAPMPAKPAVPSVAPTGQPSPTSVPPAPAMTSDGQKINAATGGIIPSGAGAGATPSAPPAPPPITPVIPQSFYDDISRAEGDVRTNTALTPEELATSEELSKLEESYKTGYLNTAQQVIPMEFITGQQKALEQRKIGLAEPLNARMARLQAKRLSALDASKFALERADKRLEIETGRNKPVSVAPGETLINPLTGKTVASGGSLSDKQALDTFYNIAQTYPDARITWNPALSPQQNLQNAQKAASESPSFQAKNTVYAINPLTGEPTIISKMGGGGTRGGGAPSGGGVTTQNLAPELKAALSNVSGVQYFDSGKVTSSQLPYLQRAAQEMGVPLLSKEDANKVQDAFGSFSSANALVDQIRTLTSTVIKAPDNAGDQTAQAARLKAIELAPYLSTDNSAKQFISARNSVLSLLTRAAGEKGVLTQQDVERIANALPSYGDSKTLAVQKANNFSNVLQSVLSGAIQTYIGGATGGGFTGGGAGGANDPLGIF